MASESSRDTETEPHKEVENGVSDLIDMIYLDTTPAVDTSVCKVISEKIETKDTSLVKVVEELGPRLTSTHVKERSKAVEILAHVFTHIHRDFLTEKELTFIVEFLCDRCKDQHMVMPKIIMCVLPVVKCKNLPAGAGAKLVENLFREANIQSHIHKIRQTFFRTLQFLLKNRLEELQNMTADFVMNFLQSMDGEKDPRNLLLLFQTIPIIINNFKLGPFSEDFFEILSCYFPVDFNPTVAVAGEEAITRKDLAHALHICLSQTNQFAEFLIPLILEKLESSSIDAKFDALDLLQMCCERSYAPADTQAYLPQVWYNMRKEIFMGGNEEVEKKCYDFLKSAFVMLSKDSSILDTCLEMIYSECKHHLTEPELRLIVPTSNILRCLTDSGVVTCSSVVQNMFPIFYDQICVKSSKSEKIRLLGIWETIISASRQYKEVEFHTLLPKWDEMCSLWFNMLTTDDWETVTITLKIFTHVILRDNDFQRKDRDNLQEHVLRLIARNSFNVPQNARLAISSVCSGLCKFYGEEFLHISVPRLLGTLSHSTSTPETLLCDNKCEEKLHCPAKALSCRVLADSSYFDKNVFEKVVSHLLENLKLNPSHYEYICCLESIMEQACKDKAEGGNLPKLATLFTSMQLRENIVSIAMEICNTAPVDEEQSGLLMTTMDADGKMSIVKVPVKMESMCQASNILRNLLRACDEREQSTMIGRYWNSDVSEKENIETKLTSIPGFLIESILGPCRPSVPISLKRDLLNFILKEILRTDRRGAFSTQACGDIYIMPLIRLFASLINKMEEEELSEYLNDTETQFEKCLFVNAQPFEIKSNHTVEINEKLVTSPSSNLINSLIWIVKGLAMRGFIGLEVWIEKVMRLLKDEILGEEVVKHFQSLLADDPYSLNPESFCRFRFLYKQRLFYMTIDKLVYGYRNAPTQATQFNFIRALSSQLKHVPSEILFMKIDSVLPLLVASLKCNSSSQVIVSTLNALTEMMHSSDTKHKLTEYSHDLIPQLIQLALHKESMDVRRLSLSCLRNCAKAPSHVILPLRDKVVDDLVPCLDDPKRLVRKEAVLTRKIWVLIGAPGGLTV